MSVARFSAGAFLPAQFERDRRITLARPDLAAAWLRGSVAAERYGDAQSLSVVAPSAPLRAHPAADAALETEALCGETMLVLACDEGWAWGQLSRDGYVGYLPESALGPAITPTHRVGVLRTHAYPGPSIKAPPAMAVSMGAELAIARHVDDFAVDANGLHFYAAHLVAIDHREVDFVAVAERFLGAPYLWGGRTSEGIDCSGLLQTALAAAGLVAPRDADMQEQALGHALDHGAALTRGDLIFWKGHVGIMRDSQTLLHASGHHMQVATEPLAQAAARIAQDAGAAIRTIRRL